MELQYNQDGSPYVMWGNNKIQLEKQPIIQEKYYLDKAEKELREFPENVEKALAELRKLLKGEPTLNIPLDDDEFLMKFLRPCKLYAESAFKRIQAYYKFRLNHEDYCSNLTPTSVRSAFKNSVISILAPRDQHGRRIMFVQSSGMFCWEGPRSPAWDPREVSLMDVFRGVQLGLEAALVEPRTQVAGVIVVFDVRGLSFSQILCFTPSFAKMIVDWIQDCAPIRLKAVHIINQPILFNMLFTIFKPFLREKLRSRIFFHGSNKQSILSHVASEALRKRHGGSLPEPDIPGEVQWKMIHHYEEDFKGEPTLNIPLDDDEFLMKFLRTCKLYAESAFKRIKAYYEFKHNHEEFSSDLTPTSVRSAFKYSIISMLAPRDQHGRRIILFQCKGWTPREASPIEIFRVMQLVLQAAAMEPRTQVAGVVFICDVAEFTWAQMLQFTPPFIKMFAEWIQDCAPIRLKAVHIINQQVLYNILFAICKPFLREKLRSRIFFHGSNKQSILSHITGEALRKRHGGSLPEPDIPGDVQWKMIHHYEDEFKVAASYGYNK